jgi:hypothetical protein
LRCPRLSAANFTDEELAYAITVLTQLHGRSPAESPDWQARLRQELQAARAAHHDIKVLIILQRLQLRVDKSGTRPVAVAGPAGQMRGGTGTPTTPVVLEVRDLASRFTGVFALERPEEAPLLESDPT